jgi:large subunit ribosomal protein L29
MSNIAELAELDDDELATRLAEYRRELLNLRFQLATSQLDNPARLSVARRDIARVLTLMREREIALAEGIEAPAAVSARRLPRRPPATDEELDVAPGGVVTEGVEGAEDVEGAEGFEGFEGAADVEGAEDVEGLVLGQDPVEGRLASDSELDEEPEEDG